MINNKDIFSSFSVFVDGIRIVSLSFNLCFFINKPLSSMSSSILEIYDRFWDFCDPSDIRWYITETMTKYRKVNKRTFSLFTDILTSTDLHKDEYLVHLKNGEEYTGTPNYGIWLYGVEEGAERYGISTSMIRFTFPAEFVCSRIDEMFELARYICNHIKISSGSVGYCLERSDFIKNKSDLAAWQLSMQHPGLDIANELRDTLGIAHDGIKGVNWLTMLSSEFADRLGGVEGIQGALPNATTTPTSSGLLIRACAEPVIGGITPDDTIAPYKSVYAVVSPLMAPIFDRYGAFVLPGGDHIAKTRAWLTRLGDD